MADDVTFTVGAIDKASGIISMLTGKFGALGTVVSSLASGNYMGALNGALSASIDFMKKAIDAAAEEETNLKTLDATIKSMGVSTQVSAVGIRTMAEAMQAANGIFSHDDLEKAAQSLLRIEGFNPSNLQTALAAIQDFAAGRGMGVAEAGEQVARALETGQVRSLGFSAALRTQIQRMITAGDKAGALALIMDTLNTKYGGQAAAQLDTYAGQVKNLKNQWGEFSADVGTKIIPVLSTVMEGLNGTNESVMAHIVRMRKQKTAIEEVSFATDAHTRYLRDLKPAIDAAAEAAEEEAVAAANLAEQYAALSDYAQSYTAYERERAALQGELATATGDSVNEIKGKLAELEEAQKRQTDLWILNILQQQLSINGLTSAEMAFLLKYQVDTGLISASSAARAQSLYDDALEMAAGFDTAAGAANSITSALNGIPGEVNSTVNIHTNYTGGGSIPTTSPTPGGGTVYRPPTSGPSEYAMGGAFSGWAMVGDAPGGRRTPYTEYVYAPRGAMVYNQAQMSGRTAPPMQTGGFIPPAASKYIDLSPSSIRAIADAMFQQISKVL